MRNSNSRPLLRPAQKDALHLALFWALVVASTAGAYFTLKTLYDAF